MFQPLIFIFRISLATNLVQEFSRLLHLRSMNRDGTTNRDLIYTLDRCETLNPVIEKDNSGEI